jgi:type II secretory pathway pseudopilin PulG
MIRHNATGFTIVELMIATSVFSLVLLVVSAGVLSFSRSYYHGVVVNNTQNITRNAMNEVVQSIQFSSGVNPIMSGSTTIGYCIGGSRSYYFALNKQITSDSQNALVNGANCAGSNDTLKNIGGSSLAVISSAGLQQPRELLGSNMRLAKFSITPDQGLYRVELEVAYGDDDLLCIPGANDSCVALTPTNFVVGDDLRCKAGVGSQFCAVVHLTSAVATRLN